MPIHSHAGDAADRITGETISIHELTRNVIKSFSGELSKRRISIDADLPNLTACVNTSVIHRAVAKLLENAIDAMPDGGQISVTLIDGRHHWELEVADSAGEIYRSGWKSNADTENADSNPGLLRVLAESQKLDLVRTAAAIHGGQVQSWKCPQGGTANVLVIPRAQISNRARRAA
jgi:K+-sensing histidine kinase KdpD